MIFPGKSLVVAILLFSVAMSPAKSEPAMFGMEELVPDTMSQQEIVNEMKRYINDHQPDDPLVEWEKDIWVKKSHLYGVCIGGKTYYYHLSPHMSFDPLSRGDVTIDQIDIVFTDPGPDHPFVIYRIKGL